MSNSREGSFSWLSPDRREMERESFARRSHSGNNNSQQQQQNDFEVIEQSSPPRDVDIQRFASMKKQLQTFRSETDPRFAVGVGPTQQGGGGSVNNHNQNSNVTGTRVPISQLTNPTLSPHSSHLPQQQQQQYQPQNNNTQQQHQQQHRTLQPPTVVQAEGSFRFAVPAHHLPPPNVRSQQLSQQLNNNNNNHQQFPQQQQPIATVQLRSVTNNQAGATNNNNTPHSVGGGGISPLPQQQQLLLERNLFRNNNNQNNNNNNNSDSLSHLGLNTPSTPGDFVGTSNNNNNNNNNNQEGDQNKKVNVDEQKRPAWVGPLDSDFLNRSTTATPAILMKRGDLAQTAISPSSSAGGATGKRRTSSSPSTGRKKGQQNKFETQLIQDGRKVIFKGNTRQRLCSEALYTGQSKIRFAWKQGGDAAANSSQYYSNNDYYRESSSQDDDNNSEDDDQFYYYQQQHQLQRGSSYSGSSDSYSYDDDHEGENDYDGGGGEENRQPNTPTTRAQKEKERQLQQQKSGGRKITPGRRGGEGAGGITPFRYKASRHHPNSEEPTVLNLMAGTGIAAEQLRRAKTEGERRTAETLLRRQAWKALHPGVLDWNDKKWKDTLRPNVNNHLGGAETVQDAKHYAMFKQNRPEWRFPANAGPTMTELRDAPVVVNLSLDDLFVSNTEHRVLDYTAAVNHHNHHNQHQQENNNNRISPSSSSAASASRQYHQQQLLQETPPNVLIRPPTFSRCDEPPPSVNEESLNPPKQQQQQQQQYRSTSSPSASSSSSSSSHYNNNNQHFTNSSVPGDSSSSSSSSSSANASRTHSVLDESAYAQVVQRSANNATNITLPVDASHFALGKTKLEKNTKQWSGVSAEPLTPTATPPPFVLPSRAARDAMATFADPNKTVHSRQASENPIRLKLDETSVSVARDQF